MKKIITMSVVLFASTVVAQRPDISECNRETPGWGRNLGEVRFLTNKTWIVGSLEWSDVVIAENCQKETFNGGTVDPRNFNADCRKNSDGLGDLFSWCAVGRYVRQLCPDNWRVPTTQDFMYLDEFFGGNGERRRVDRTTLAQYTETWGGSYGGICRPDGRLEDQNNGAFYWAISAGRTGTGSRLNFFTNGYISPQGWVSKNFGHTVRCVRNAE